MKLYLNMPKGLVPHYDNTLQLYYALVEQGHLSQAWAQLERAHIIGQAYPYQHTQVHWLMLKFGMNIKSMSEIIGQIPRLLVGGVKSFVGVIPIGNTGGANVSPLKPMEIPEDIKQLLDQYK